MISEGITYRCFTCGAEMSAMDIGEQECESCREFRRRLR
jgi:DNA-directed RNA polymerase subunit RPC12/RpoP